MVATGAGDGRDRRVKELPRNVCVSTEINVYIYNNTRSKKKRKNACICIPSVEKQA